MTGTLRSLCATSTRKRSPHAFVTPKTGGSGRRPKSKATATAPDDGDPLDAIREMIAAESLDQAEAIWRSLDVPALRRLAKAGTHGRLAMALASELAEAPALKAREARPLVGQVLGMLAAVAVGDATEVKRAG